MKVTFTLRDDGPGELIVRCDHCEKPIEDRTLGMVIYHSDGTVRTYHKVTCDPGRDTGMGDEDGGRWEELVTFLHRLSQCEPLPCSPLHMKEGITLAREVCARLFGDRKVRLVKDEDRVILLVDVPPDDEKASAIWLDYLGSEDSLHIARLTGHALTIELYYQ